MKKLMSVLVLSGLMITAVLAWGQVQRQTLPMASRTTDDTKQEVARLKAEVDRLTKVVAEVDRLTKVIKVTGSSDHPSVSIEAPHIALKGVIRVNQNPDGQAAMYVYSNAYFYAQVYGYNANFVVFK